MKSKLYLLSAVIVMSISMNGCSYFTKKSSKTTSVSNEMSFPPTLKKTPSRPTLRTAKQKLNNDVTNTRIKTASPIININPNNNYYIIVGTYPNNDQALDMFIKMSSLGFTNTAMETRKTRQGSSLHMVRLGPFNKQNDIDKTTNALSNAGMTQFKVVEN